MRVLLCIPTYNEIDNLKPLVESVLSQTPEELHVLIIDDNSPDGTGKLADTLASQNERVHVLHRQEKQGLGRAYLAGFKWGLERDYDAIVEMDADFSHHPKYLSKMLDCLKEFDVAVGSRYVDGGGTINWGLIRKIISRGGSLYSRWILGVPIRDYTGGFNGWRRQVLESIEMDTIQSDGYAFQIELKYRAALKGFKIKEFPIVFEDRTVGQSKMSSHIVFEALLKVWEFRLRTWKKAASPQDQKSYEST